MLLAEQFSQATHTMTKIAMLTKRAGSLVLRCPTFWPSGYLAFSLFLQQRPDILRRIAVSAVDRHATYLFIWTPEFPHDLLVRGNLK